MKKLLDPKWIFIANTLPIILLYIVGIGEYNVIKSLLTTEQHSLWNAFGFSLVSLGVLSLVYAIYKISKKEEIDINYSITSLIVYTIYLIVYTTYSDDFISRDVPRWLFSGNLLLYTGAFIMPTLIHALLCLVIDFTPNTEDQKASPNILKAILTPIVFYIFAMLIIPFWNGESNYGSTLFLMLIVPGIICFVFFLLRFVYIIISKKNINEYNLVFFKILIALIFPIIGLALNTAFNNLFGDFSSLTFFALAVINGVLIILPSSENRIYRLILFFGRCVTFTFTLYFFIIFLPFIPLAVLAILLFFLGLLMLVPLFLFAIHIDLIYEDLKYLEQYYKKYILYTTMAIGIVAIPICTFLSYKNDRSVLFLTLDYLYNPDYSKDYKLNTSSILRTLNVINEKNTNDNFFYSSTPFLSSYFKRIVLDNLILSNKKTQLISNVFDDTSNRYEYRDQLAKIGNDKISITDVQQRSQYDDKTNTWTSWIDLSIKNNGAQLWESEYITQINLPDGCWISDYYLYVEGVKEMGILAEKKAATWIFSQIRNENRDPGMLHYISGNQIDFRVFPFQTHEVRYTGIEFIHKEPVTINIDNYSIQIGRTNEKEQGIESQIIHQAENKHREVAYVSSKEKENLTTISRQPYYHFIVDISSANNQKLNNYKSDIKELLSKDLVNTKNSKISYVGTYVETKDFTEGWEEDLKSKKSDGGFFLDRAFKKIFFESYTNPTNTYPIIVVLSEQIDRAIMYGDLAEMKFAYPESDKFYSINNGKLAYYSFYENISKQPGIEVVFIPEAKVKAWPSAINPVAYLPIDSLPSIVLNTKKKTIDSETLTIKEKDWESALMMQGQWMLQTLYPQTADEEWLNLVENSFKSRILTPLTSYIVVETEAQKAMLKKKQDEALSGNKALDLNNETQEMSEPSIWILLLILGSMYFLNKRRINKKRA